MMQKVFNVLTVISFGAVTIATAAGVYVYTNKDAIVEEVKAQVIKAATEGVSNAMGAELSGQLMPGVASPTGGDKPAGGLPVPIPTMPF